MEGRGLSWSRAYGAIFGDLPKFVAVIFSLGFVVFLCVLLLFGFLAETDFESRLDTKFTDAQLRFSDGMSAELRLLEGISSTIADNGLLIKAFTQRDRKSLLLDSQEIFLLLRSQFKVTHWYFIEPNGSIFLRVHEPEDFGELDERDSLSRVKASGRASRGIELGKNGVALRFVRPLIRELTAVGYLEMGSELNGVLDDISGRTASDFAVALPKQKLSQANWFRQINRGDLQQTWDRYTDFVITSQSEGFEPGCVDESKFVQGMESPLRFAPEYNLGGSFYRDGSFSCGVFPLRNPSGESVGAVFVEFDTTSANATNRLFQRGFLFAFGFGCLGMAMVILLLRRRLGNPIHEIAQAAISLEQGSFDRKVDIHTKDEFQDIGDSFNKSLDILKKIDEERKEVDRAKTKFLSITSHELRSPITPMKAQEQMLLDNYFGRLTRQQREALDIVLRNTDRLDAILADFLEVSRIETARLKFDFVKLDIIPRIRDLVKEISDFGKQKGISIVLDCPRRQFLKTDPDRLTQVLRNLLNNAVKFSPDDSKVVVSVKKLPTYVEISVKDQGIGIATQNQARIFEPFFQEEQSIYRKYGGTGLGLSICRGIVEAQGGRIWFESEKGKGSTFHFTFPLTPIKNIIPIRILFSGEERLKSRVRQILINNLGPLGEGEYTRLLTRGLNESILLEYADELRRKGVLRNTKKIKGEIREAFSMRAAKGIMP